MSTINVEAGDMGLVVAFVLLLGGIIKNYTPVKNELIPLITWAMGGLLYQWLAGGWADPRQWMMALLSVAGATGLHSATRSTIEVVKPPPARLPLLLLCVGLLATTGMTCRKVDATADPIVVRTEQTLELARSTFLFTLQVNDKDREFWRAQAPEFHRFCEVLRKPTPYPLTSTNLLPQYRVWLLSVDDVKRDYKAGRATGDAVLTAIGVLNGMLEQAVQWNSVLTNRINNL